MEKTVMIGAIIGDFVGVPYEFDGELNKKYLARLDFPLFTKKSKFTDDTVMTIAVGEAVMNRRNDPNLTKREVVKCMQLWGAKYPDGGYGGRFKDWLKEKHPQPYNSYGNGSAMRVSAVGWLYDTIEDVLEYAEITAAVTHDHPEGIKGAQSVAAAIFLARTGHSKEEIKRYIEENFHYDLNRTIDEIRPGYKFDETCQGSVPESIIAFLESTSFEDAVRRAVSLDGDADTQGAIAGSIAEAFYGIPEDLKVEVKGKLPSDMKTVLLRFNKEKFSKSH